MKTEQNENTYTLVLASASPRRRELLTQIGLEFRVIKSTCEEIITSNDPESVVKELSAQKASDVWQKLMTENPETEVCGAEPVNTDSLIVLGADTVVTLDGKILGKPKDAEDAANMLRLLSGRIHRVYTGVTLISKEETRSAAVCTEVSFYDMTDEEIAEYVASGDPMDKAGAYGIQCQAAKFIKGIAGDYNNVVGLPVACVYQTLKEMLGKRRS